MPVIASIYQVKSAAKSFATRLIKHLWFVFGKWYKPIKGSIAIIDVCLVAKRGSLFKTNQLFIFRTGTDSDILYM